MWVFFLNPDGTLRAQQRIANGIGGGPTLASADNFGGSLVALGDMNSDGLVELAVGATGDDSGGGNRGAVHLLQLRSDGTVASRRKLTSGTGAIPALAQDDLFGGALTSPGDLDGNGTDDLIVGARRTDSNNPDSGAAYVLLLNSSGEVQRAVFVGNSMGGGLASLGDLDGDGLSEIVVGARGDDTGGAERGAAYVLSLLPDFFGPWVTSFTRWAPTSATTSANSVVFRAAFSEPVSDVDVADFSVNGLSSAVVSNVTLVNPAVYEITVSGGDLANFTGSLGLNLSFAANLVDISGNFLQRAEPPIDELYDFDNTAPIITSFIRHIPAGQITTADQLIFRASFSEAIQPPSPGDFEVVGAGMVLAVNPVTSSLYELVVGGEGLVEFNGSVSLNLALGQMIRDLAGNLLASGDPPIDEQYSLVNPLTDFGDAPDEALGTGSGNYRTTLADNGPRHTLVAGLRLGERASGETDASPNRAANGDDRFIAPEVDDEDGLVIPALDLNLTIGGAPTVAVRATNLTGAVAMLSGWIDYNRDGVFDNASERAQVAVPTGSNGAVFQLTFPQIPLSTAGGATYARFRISTDAAAEQPVGPALDGEVEDYVATVQKISGGLVDAALTKKVAHNTNGGPTLSNFSTYFGFATTSLGDLDGDGVPDLAVGVPLDDFAVAQGQPWFQTNAGSVYVMFMNADGSVKNRTLITGGQNGGPGALSTGDFFGASVANIGDIDGDGVIDLAVGAHGDDTGGDYSGAVYVLRMNASGSVKALNKISSSGNGGPVIASASEFFGRSIAALGDFDGDGIGDVLVGAPGADTGALNAGAAYVLLLNSNGTLKSHVRLASGINGGPALAHSDAFGGSVATIGDLDGDGVTDVAVGAAQYDRYSRLSGGNAVYVLLMNADGTIKTSRKISSASVSAGSDPIAFGASLAATGDLDGDGVGDLAVGSTFDDLGGVNRGSVRLVYLNPDGAPKASRVIGSSIGGGPLLSNGDNFGASITAFPDLNGDGLGELIVGATGDDTGLYGFGAFYTLFLAADTQVLAPFSFARQLPSAVSTNADAIVFRVTFAEDVFGVDANDFLTNSASTAIVTTVTQVSQLQYDVTLSGGDLANFSGAVGLNLAPTASIQDRSGNVLMSQEPAIDEVYVLDNVAPVVSFGRLAPATAITSADAVRFRVTFSEVVQNVDATDFVASAAAATVTLRQVNATEFEVTLSGGSLANFVGEVGLNLAALQNIADQVGNALPTLEPAVDEAFTFVTSTLDFGDAPDSAVGAATGNYATTLADNGPRHVVVPGLRLGAGVDTEPDAVVSSDAESDDLFVTPDRDDEDALVGQTGQLTVTIGSAPSFALRATNSMGAAAQLYGWIDFNRDGVFDDSTERANAPVPAGSANVVITLTFPTVPTSGPVGTSMARFRLSTDVAAATSTGLAQDGEVEDYAVSLQRISDGLIDSTKNKRISSGVNGGPVFSTHARFGRALAPLGDLDGDGVPDVAVTSWSDPTPTSPSGAVHVLFMNADGTVKNSRTIGSQYNGGPTFSDYDGLGSSLAAIGDLDGDGITELAVGAYADDTGGINRGAIYIWSLNRDGFVRNSVKIAQGLNGGPSLVNNEQFGFTATPLGDVDGDGVPDLAVASRSTSNSIRVLNLNPDGSVKQTAQVTPASLFGSGVVGYNALGKSYTKLGDLDGDGVGDALVGLPSSNVGGIFTGSANVLFLRADGTVKRKLVLASGTNGAPNFTPSDGFGSSVTAIGDLNGDGLQELAIGASETSIDGTLGAVHILFLRPDATAPVLDLIIRATPLGALTNDDSLTFRISFNSEVVGVSPQDFVPSGTTTATVTAVTMILPSVYDVTVSGGDLATFNGMVGLNLAPGQNITDRAGNPLPTLEPATDQAYTLDNTPPTLAITRLVPLTALTSDRGVRFSLSFSEVVQNAGPTDFAISGPAGNFTLTPIGPTTYELTISSGLEGYIGEIGVNLVAGHNIVDAVGNALPTAEPSVDETFTRVASSFDFGDAPDSALGVGVGNYATQLADNGPRHTVVSGIYLGSGVDAEPETKSNWRASGDDAYITPDVDDETGALSSGSVLEVKLGLSPLVKLRATNLTATAANLYGWIDFNRDGVFDDATERASIGVAPGASNGLFTLTFPTVPLNNPTGETFARFRLSTDASAASSVGAASDGEVEDYAVTMTKLSAGVVNPVTNVEVAHNESGALVLGSNAQFGKAVTTIGDLDRDGVADLTVGASGMLSQGAVRLLLMNPNGTVKGSQLIAGSQFLGTGAFGWSVTAVGDLDGDNIQELAVGAPQDDTGGQDRGAVHLLFLNSSGTVRHSVKIASGTAGVPALANADLFGSALTALGDLDGDGVTELAVGAVGDDAAGGSSHGAVYVLFLNSSGDVKHSTELSSGVSGAPTLSSGDAFGRALAAIGDLDGDGVTELAVGAIGDDTGGFSSSYFGRGAVHVLFLNPDATVKSRVKIASGLNGGPPLAIYDSFGMSLANIGDLDGDGINEVAVGSPYDDAGGLNRGSINVLFLNAAGDVRERVKIASGLSGGPNLQDGDSFGGSVTLLGDLDGDGLTELAVGAANDDTVSTSDSGAIHVLRLQVDSSAPTLQGVRRLSPTAEITAADTLTFRVTFNEIVVNVDSADFQTSGATSATVASITKISDNVYDVQLAGGDLASHNGVVGLKLASGQNIADRLGNNLSAAEPPINQTYTVDNSPPTLSIRRMFPAVSLTSANALRFRLSFSEPVLNVDASDFIVTGTTASGVLATISPAEYELTISGGDLASLVGVVGVNIAPGANITDLIGTSLPVAEPAIDEAYTLVTSTMDFGDAPYSAVGIGSVRYATSLADNGPRHTIVPGLLLGTRIDEEPDASTATSAAGDDQFLSPDADDEDGLALPNFDTAFAIGSQPTISLQATNATGAPAMLYGWIDYNRDGVFDNNTERSAVAVPSNTTSGVFTLTFPTVSIGAIAGATYARFRLSTDPAAANPTGAASDGEVEDHELVLTSLGDGSADGARTKLIANGVNGGPILASRDYFSSAIAALGDFDGDGVPDLIAGSPQDDTGGSDRGAIYLLMMTPSGAVRSSLKIASGVGGGPSLVSGDRFGSSVATLGDLDGNGVIDLAVGAAGDDTAGFDRGAVHVLLLNANGTVKSTLKIASGSNGGPNLLSNDAFGGALAALGDLDGDGITELAVGARGDDTGGSNRGATYVLFLNSTGSVRSSVKLAHNTNGGPALATADGFGHALAAMGDLDGDGVPDLAVGAAGDDTGGSNRGAVHLLLLNRSGTARARVKLASGAAGGPTLANGDAFGSSLATIGDLNGDGVAELAVGTPNDDAGGYNRGSVQVLMLSPTGQIKSSLRITTNQNGGPVLTTNDYFGVAVAAAGDFNGDGLTDLAVGQIGRVSQAHRGALQTLFLKPLAIPSLPGDFDRDGEVDSEDYNLWRQSFGVTSGPGLAADGNRDGVVDTADYSLWRDNLGATHQPGDFNRDGIVDPPDRALWAQYFGATSGLGLLADGVSDGVIDAADYTIWRDNFTSPLAVATSAVSSQLLSITSPIAPSPARRAAHDRQDLHSVAMSSSQPARTTELLAARDAAFAELEQESAQAERFIRRVPSRAPVVRGDQTRFGAFKEVSRLG